MILMYWLLGNALLISFGNNDINYVSVRTKTTKSSLPSVDMEVGGGWVMRGLRGGKIKGSELIRKREGW